MKCHRASLLVWLPLAFVACTENQGSTTHPGVEAVAAELPPPTAVLAGGGGSPGEPSSPSGALLKSAAGQGEGAAAADPISTDEQLLGAYREVYCHQKNGDPGAVVAVWERYGFTSATWARAAQRAVQRAYDDPEGFGRVWASISHKPCP